MATLVRHVMTAAPKTLSPSMDAYDAAGMMANFDIGAVPVVDEGTLVGLVTDRDLVVRVLAGRADPSGVRLGDLATRSLISVTPDMPLTEARELMAEHRVRRLPVVKDDQLVGIVSLGDLAVASASKRVMGEALEEISGSESTEDRNPGPDAGTPERVQESR
jgi:CBS domain-containing protein